MSLKFSACGGWFGKNNYDTYAAAAQKGFTAVEQLSWLGLDFEKASSEMKKNKIVSTAIIFQSKDEEVRKKIAWDHGMVWEDALDAHVASFIESVEAAKALGVPNIISTVGNERGDASRYKQHDNIVKTLSTLAPIAEENGLMIVLEPLNTKISHKGYYLAESDEAFDIIRSVNSPNVKLLFDIFHQQVTEGNVIHTIVKNIDLIGHFHVADSPARQEPGTGELNYHNIFKAINETGYDRYIAFECGASGGCDDVCEKMKKLISPFES